MFWQSVPVFSNVTRSWFKKGRTFETELAWNLIVKTTTQKGFWDTFEPFSPPPQSRHRVSLMNVCKRTLQNLSLMITVAEVTLLLSIFPPSMSKAKPRKQLEYFPTHDLRDDRESCDSSRSWSVWPLNVLNGWSSVMKISQTWKFCLIQTPLKLKYSYFPQ